MVNPSGAQYFFWVVQVVLKNKLIRTSLRGLTKSFRLSLALVYGKKNQTKETNAKSSFSKVIKPDLRPLFTDAPSNVRKT